MIQSSTSAARSGVADAVVLVEQGGEKGGPLTASSPRPSEVGPKRTLSPPVPLT
jgi:hypothetical protein